MDDIKHLPVRMYVGSPALGIAANNTRSPICYPPAVLARTSDDEEYSEKSAAPINIDDVRNRTGGVFELFGGVVV